MRYIYMCCPNSLNSSPNDVKLIKINECRVISGPEFVFLHTELWCFWKVYSIQFFLSSLMRSRNLFSWTLSISTPTCICTSVLIFHLQNNLLDFSFIYIWWSFVYLYFLLHWITSFAAETELLNPWNLFLDHDTIVQCLAAETFQLNLQLLMSQEVTFWNRTFLSLCI